MASGVYVIENTATGRRYVGSAVNIDKRWKEHRRQLSTGRHHSRFMQRCWSKYGPEAFVFRVLLFCDRHNLLWYEQALLNAWIPEYNTAPTAGSQLGLKMSDDSKEKMSRAAKRTKNFTGHRHTEDTKRRISEAKRGHRYGPYSAERRAKVGASLKARIITQVHLEKISRTLTGTSTGRGQLMPEQVREIRKLRALGLGRIRIGKQLGLRPSTVNAVTGGHAYGWVK